MKYDEMIDRIERFDYIPDRRTADAACKAVWGIIASSVDEPVAAEVTSELPEPLTEAKLRSHQARKLNISSENFIDEISWQFNVEHDQARELVETILHTGEESLQEDSLSRLKQSVPEDLATLL